MFQTKVVDKKNTFCFQKRVFFSENRALYDIMWKNIVERVRPQTIIWRKLIAYWMPKATNTLTRVV